LGLISFVKIKKFCSFCMMLWACNGVLLILTGILISKVHNGLKSGLNILHDFDMIELLKNRQFQKLLAIVSIAGIISVVSGYGVNASLQYTYTQKEKQREAKLIEDFKKDYEKYEKVSIKVDDIEPFIGTNESPVHIVVFFDFNCGACHRAVSLLHEIALKYQSKVALYLRHFPLDGTCNRFIPRKKDGTSCRASLVAYSLYGKSEYINFVLQLMQYRGSINEEVIKEAIVNVHQDWADVEKKSYSPEVRKRLENDIALGGKLDISATPTIIINNTKLRPGIPPAYILEMAIKIEMAKRQ
ncbi:MAG: thioredoxin domain-containing protein, partial [Spirochaetes bacterium]|nr:thioredoxin domain-containing protein [Spirochaetota bacterium]